MEHQCGAVRNSSLSQFWDGGFESHQCPCFACPCQSYGSSFGVGLSVVWVFLLAPLLEAAEGGLGQIWKSTASCLMARGTQTARGADSTRRRQHPQTARGSAHRQRPDIAPPRPREAPPYVQGGGNINSSAHRSATSCARSGTAAVVTLGPFSGVPAGDSARLG